MTKSTITRERLEKIKSWRETYGTGSNVMLPAEEAEELASMALAAIDSKPFAYIIQDKYERERGVEGHLSRSHVSKYVSQDDINEHEITCTPLYRHAQPAPERDQVRIAHAEWSQATFGNVGPVGPLKHLSKEALEAAEQPSDLSEWADMQFLLWDAQRRAGITDEQITQAMIEKLAVNKQREWPEPKDGEPRLHIKEQQAPVVEREPIAWLNDAYLARGVVDGEAGSEDAGPGYIPVYREAGPQPAPVVPDEMLCEFYEVDSWPDLVRELVKHVEQLQDSARRNVKPWEDTFPETLLPAYIERVKQADDACRAAMLAAAPQEVPDEK